MNSFLDEVNPCFSICNMVNQLEVLFLLFKRPLFLYRDSGLLQSLMTCWLLILLFITIIPFILTRRMFFLSHIYRN